MFSLLLVLACTPQEEIGSSVEIPDTSPDIVDTEDTGEEILPVVEEIVIGTEDELLVVTGPEGGEPVQFTATRHWDDGTEEEIQPEWSLSNEGAGSIDEEGLFTPSMENGGKTDVIGTYEGVSGSTELTVRFEIDIVEGGVDPAWFDEEAVEVDEDGLSYPEDETVIPLNTPSLNFQLHNRSARGYRLRFASEITEVNVYTDQTSWTSSEEIWPVIGSTNAGGAIEMEVYASRGEGDLQMYRVVRLFIQEMEGSGSIIYWTPTTEGLMKIPFGEQAESYLAPGHCVGCHVISSKGIMAYSNTGGYGTLAMANVDDLSPVLESGVVQNFKAFSPDGEYLLVNAYGVLYLLDGNTGEQIEQVAFDTPVYSTHMDWSPDNSQVAMVIPSSVSYDYMFTGGVIAVSEHLGDGVFGEPEVIFDPGEGYNAYYPAFSPDGQWIAFNISTEDAYDDVTAELWVMPANGGDAIQLNRANFGESMGNSWPRWAPAAEGDTEFWLTFASRRTYGSITGGNPQIWVSAFDTALATAGKDPSAPAFWLPNQDTTSNNHLPVWAP